MARRRSYARAEGVERSYGKSQGEARVERLTWALLVLIFAIPLLIDISIPNGFVPLAGAIVLLGSGAYQYSRRWRVSPITWVGGSLMLFLSILNLALDSERDFTGWALAVVAVVIVFGAITGET